MEPRPTGRPRWIACAIACCCLVAGAAVGGTAFIAAGTHPLVGFGLTCLAFVALVGTFAGLRRSRQGPGVHWQPLTPALLLLPMALLSSVPAATLASLGWRHPLTLGSLALVALMPMWLALRAARLNEAAFLRWRGNALAAAIAIAVGLLGLELGVRWTGADPGATPPPFHETPFRTVRSAIPRVGWELAPEQEWRTVYPSNERGYFDADGAVSYRTNRDGYRGDELALGRPAHTRRIALLGDSFAFGLGVKEGDTVARQLARALSDGAACPTEVLSFAVPGYTTDQEEALLRRRVRRYRPDLAIVWYFLNDVEVAGTLAFLGGDDPRGCFPLARRVSALARLVGVRLDAQLSQLALVRTYREAYRTSDTRWQVVEAAFDRMGRTAREHDLRVVVCVHPVLFRLGPGYPFAAIHRQVIESARRSGLEAYDLSEAFAGHQPEALWVHRSDQHPNEIAHALAARFVAERVRPLLPACNGNAPQAPSAQPASPH